MISDKDKAMFDMIKGAVRDGSVALIQCRDEETGDPVSVLCALDMDERGGVRITPFARLLDPDDPTAGLVPPEGAEADPPSAGEVSR